ncbi:MAG: glycosyltransferase family 2 protein [Salinivirgaceae bacterium]
MEENIHISVITPVYGCKTCLYELYIRLKQTLDKLSPDFEIIMVNDASPDGSWETILELGQKDQRVKGINLSRNFGQHYAITAGLNHAKGDWCIVMDCDLQDQPEEIENLYKKVLEGYDVVFGLRHERKDKFFKKISSYLFLQVYNLFVDDKLPDTKSSNFSIISKKVIQAYNGLSEQYITYGLIIRWLGFKTESINIEHSKRPYGKSTYSFSKSVTHAINSIVSQSNKLLIISIKFVFILSLLSLITGIYLIIDHLFFKVTYPGWTSTMVSLFFVAGLLFANLGLIGLYIGKIFDETKRRPSYIISDKINL